MSQQKEWVKERYGNIATGKQRGCCGDASCCDPAATGERIGYRAEELAAVPEGANLGLGCGNPVALASIQPGETVLDLGAGAGFDALLAAARVGPEGRVIGVDLTPEMVAQARANATKAGAANVEFRLGDIETLPVEDACVDLVISNCVINLTPDKAKVFREIARVLRPGGRMAISDLVLDKPLPEKVVRDDRSYCACLTGAIPRHDYLKAVEEAGLVGVGVVSEAEEAELMAGDLGVSESDLRGVITSISVTARKPGDCC